MTSRILLIPVLAVSLAVAACGGGAEQPAAPAKPRMTKAQYIAAGNKICRDTVAKSPAFPGTRKKDQYSTAPSLMSEYLLAVQNLTVQANKGFQILRPPKPLESAHRELLAAQDARITDMGLAINAVSSNDKAGLNKAVQQDVNIDAPRYTQAAEAAGLSACIRHSASKK
jgi:hypothetical protein